MSTTPTTMLEAVNELLTAIGTAPVNTLDVPGLTDAAIAQQTINTVSRELQSHGWWFNTSRSVLMSPTGGVISVPASVIRVSPAQATAQTAAEQLQFVLRAGQLYNIVINSNVFSSPVRVDTVTLFAFEQLPESARRAITVRAARIFQTKVLGDEALGVFTSVHEQEAFQALERDHLQSSPGSTIYYDRMLQRFNSVRPNPIGHAGNAGGGGGRQQE